MKYLAWYVLILTVFNMIVDFNNKQITKNVRRLAITVNIPVIIFFIFYLFK